jgi:hypothetical protein
MTAQDSQPTSVPIEGPEDIDALVAALGVERAWSLLTQDDENIMFHRMLYVSGLMSAYTSLGPDSLEQYQKDFMAMAVREDDDLWAYYYLAESWQVQQTDPNLPDHAMNQIFGNELEGLYDPLEDVDTDYELADWAMAPPAVGQDAIGSEGSGWAMAYPPEFYSLSPEEREAALEFHAFLDPRSLAEAALTSDDQWLFDNIIDAKIVDGVVISARYRKMNRSFFNQAWDVAGQFTPGRSTAAADPTMWRPYGEGEINWATTLATLYPAARLPRAISAMRAATGAARTVGAGMGAMTPARLTRLLGFLKPIGTPASKFYRATAMTLGVGGGVSYAGWSATDLFRAWQYGEEVEANRQAAIDASSSPDLPDAVEIEMTPQERDAIRRGPQTGQMLPDGPLAPTPYEPPTGPFTFAPGSGPAAGGGPVSPTDSPEAIEGTDPTLPWKDNPFVGFEDESMLAFDPETGQPLIEQRRSHDPGVWGDKLIQQGRANVDDFTRMSMPTYKRRDVEATIADMTPGELKLFRALAVEAKLINPNVATYLDANGRDEFTLAAMETAMERANRSSTEAGMDWMVQLQEMARLGREQDRLDELENARTFTRDAYIKPDPAYLKEYAMGAIENQLGRKANDWELEMLASDMRSSMRAQHDAVQEAKYQTWLAEGRLLEDDSDLTLNEGEEVQGVHWEARFKQHFRDKFGNELDRKERTEEVAEETGDLMTGLRRGIGGL